MRTRTEYDLLHKKKSFRFSVILPVDVLLSVDKSDIFFDTLDILHVINTSIYS